MFALAVPGPRQCARAALGLVEKSSAADRRNPELPSGSARRFFQRQSSLRGVLLSPRVGTPPEEHLVVSVPEFAPMIMKDNDGWRVSLVRDGRVHVYKCENERDA